MKIVAIAGLVVYAAWILILGTRQGTVRWRAAITLALPATLLFPVAPLLSAGLLLKGYRTDMPLEYVLTGWSINGPISAKAAMRGEARSISARPRPMISPLRNTFSRPLNSGLKPAPSSRSAETRPLTDAVPLVG